MAIVRSQKAPLVDLFLLLCVCLFVCLLAVQDKTQQTMLVTWIIEIYLTKLGDLKDGDNSPEEVLQVQDQFRHFLKSTRVKVRLADVDLVFVVPVVALLIWCIWLCHCFCFHAGTPCSLFRCHLLGCDVISRAFLQTACGCQLWLGNLPSLLSLFV